MLIKSKTNTAQYKHFFSLVPLLLVSPITGMQVAAEDEMELIQAAGKGSYSQVERLLDAGADVKIKDDIGGTALHAAANIGHDDICELLLKNKARIDEPNKYGNTALHLAAKKGFESTCRLLLRNGAHKNLPNKGNMTAAQLAEQNDHHAVAAIINGAETIVQATSAATRMPKASPQQAAQLPTVQPKQPQQQESAVKQLAAAAKVITVKKANDQLTPPPTSTVKTTSPVQSPRKEKISSNTQDSFNLDLIDGSVDSKLTQIWDSSSASKEPIPESMQASYLNSLSSAVSLGQQDKVRDLFERGLKIPPGKYDWLSHGCLNNAYYPHEEEARLSILKMLHHAGVKLDQKDEGGSTPLHYAAAVRYAKVALYLLENGAKVDIKNKYNETPLHLLVIDRFNKNEAQLEELVKLLVRYGADINARKYQDTPLHIATMKESWKAEIFMRILEQNGADVTLKNGSNKTALQLHNEYREQIAANRERQVKKEEKQKRREQNRAAAEFQAEQAAKAAKKSAAKQNKAKEAAASSEKNNNNKSVTAAPPTIHAPTTSPLSAVAPASSSQRPPSGEYKKPTAEELAEFRRLQANPASAKLTAEQQKELEEANRKTVESYETLNHGHRRGNQYMNNAANAVNTVGAANVGQFLANVFNGLQNL